MQTNKHKQCPLASGQEVAEKALHRPKAAVLSICLQKVLRHLDHLLDRLARVVPKGLEIAHVVADSPQGLHDSSDVGGDQVELFRSRRNLSETPAQPQSIIYTTRQGEQV